MPVMKRPWKRSFRKLPASFEQKLAELGNGPVRIACARVVPRAVIEDGHLLPLGVAMTPEGLALPDAPVLPPRSNGPWARRNLDGWEIVRRDLPMVSRTFSVEVPNFGDWSRGSHDITRTREVYQRDFVPPRNARIVVTHEGPAPGENAEVFSFALDDVLVRDSDDFARELLLAVNTLQESTGCSGIVAADVTPDEVLRYTMVEWEIFPASVSDADLERAFVRTGRLSPQAREVLMERRRHLQQLGPREYVWGTAFGDSAYFGGLFADDVAVFENVTSGNALYILVGDWRSLSQLSRSELQRSGHAHCRIVHRGDWRTRLGANLRRVLAEQAKQRGR